MTTSLINLPSYDEDGFFVLWSKRPKNSTVRLAYDPGVTCLLRVTRGLPMGAWIVSSRMAGLATIILAGRPVGLPVSIQLCLVMIVAR